MSDELRVGDGTTGEPDGTQTPAQEEVEAVPEAEVVGVGAPGVPEPDDDDLSPWYADLEDDDPDLPPEAAEAGDGSEDESPEEPVRQSLHVSPLDDEGIPARRSPWRGRGRRLVKREPGEQRYFSPEERLLLLDTWQRSGLPAKDFSGLVGVSKHTLYQNLSVPPSLSHSSVRAACRGAGSGRGARLVPPSETEELPEPVAPAGTVGPDSRPGFEEPPAPGTSAIDSGMSEGGGV